MSPGRHRKSASVVSNGQHAAESSASPTLGTKHAPSPTHHAAQHGDIVIEQHPLVHRLDTSGSVQAIIVDDGVIFAGLQGGQIVAWSLKTYELLAKVSAHQESVLGLSLSDDHSLLFSVGTDSIVNVWTTSSLQRLYSFQSQYEVGDIFCVTYSQSKSTWFCGSQNSSIQWHKLDLQRDGKVDGSSSTSSSFREHRFFDSRGPGGAINPTTDIGDEVYEKKLGGTEVTIPLANYHPYAHRSYIYCMLLASNLTEDDPQEEILVTAGGGGTIKLWSLKSLNDKGLGPITKFKNKGSSVLSLAYRWPFLYAGMSDGIALIFNLAAKQLVQRLQVGHGDVSQIQVSMGMIFCGTSEGQVKQFNSQFGEVDSWQANQGKLLATSLFSHGRQQSLATGGNDCTIALWDMAGRARAMSASAARGYDDLLSALRRFVSYRTVPGNPRFVRDCHEAVTFLRKQCNAFGAATTLLSPGEGINPILLAKFRATQNPDAKRTILFYGHYDVVDAEVATPDKATNWLANPFDLSPRNGFLYGRGVTDDKGPILAALYAVAALIEDDSLSCNVTFLLEGDEEAGSRGFQKLVQNHRGEIGEVDHILLSNSYWLDDHIPCLTFGMRGVVHAIIALNSDQPDLHSGMDGKAIQHEPLKDLTVLLGRLIGSSGTEVMIPDFYDAVDDLDDTEKKAYLSLTSALSSGHPEIKNEKHFAQSLIQRWRYPNLTVHRIEVPESKTAVTISGSTKATLSIRIVPSQTADEVAATLITFLHDEFAKLNSTNKLDVQITGKADPWLGDIHNPLFETFQTAITEAWSSSSDDAGTRTFSSNPDDPFHHQPKPHRRRTSSLANKGTFKIENTPRAPLFIREGGSIPAISFLEKEFDAPAAMFPMGQASDNAHLDNERIRVENLYKGKEIFQKVFSRI